MGRGVGGVEGAGVGGEGVGDFKGLSLKFSRCFSGSQSSVDQTRCHQSKQDG